MINFKILVLTGIVLVVISCGGIGLLLLKPELIDTNDPAHYVVGLGIGVIFGYLGLMFYKRCKDYLFFNAIWEKGRELDCVTETEARKMERNLKQMVTKEITRRAPADISNIVHGYCARPKIFDARTDKFDEWFRASTFQMAAHKQDTSTSLYIAPYVLTPLVCGEKFTFLVPGKLKMRSLAFMLYCTLDETVYRNVNLLANFQTAVGLKCGCDANITFKRQNSRATIEFNYLKEGVDCDYEDRINLHMITLHSIHVYNKWSMEIRFQYDGKVVGPNQF